MLHCKKCGKLAETNCNIYCDACFETMRVAKEKGILITKERTVCMACDQEFISVNKARICPKCKKRQRRILK